jgi:hypothetical protein
MVNYIPTPCSLRSGQTTEAQNQHNILIWPMSGRVDA